MDEIGFEVSMVCVVFNGINVEICGEWMETRGCEIWVAMIWFLDGIFIRKCAIDVGFCGLRGNKRIRGW